MKVRCPLEISFMAVALDFEAFLHKQPGLKSQIPKNLKELAVVVAQNEETN